MECKMEHGGRIHLSFQIFYFQITEWVRLIFVSDRGGALLTVLTMLAWLTLRKPKNKTVVCGAAYIGTEQDRSDNMHR